MVKQTLRKDANSKFFKANTWESAQERDLDFCCAETGVTTHLHPTEQQ